MGQKAKTVACRCVAAGITAVVLIAPAAAAEGHAVVLAKGKPDTPADTQGAPCPGAYYCLSPGTDPQIPTERIRSFLTDPTS